MLKPGERSEIEDCEDTLKNLKENIDSAFNRQDVTINSRRADDDLLRSKLIIINCYNPQLITYWQHDIQSLRMYSILYIYLDMIVLIVWRTLVYLSGKKLITGFRILHLQMYSYFLGLLVLGRVLYQLQLPKSIEGMVVSDVTCSS